VVLYLLVGFVSLISAIFVTDTVLSHLGALHYLRRIEYFLPLFLGMVAIKTTRQSVLALSLLFAVTVGVIFYGIGQIYFGFPVISTANEEYSKGLLLPLTEGARVNSTFAGSYDLAAFLTIVISTGFAFLAGASLSFRQKLPARIGLFLIILASYWLLLNTESRISFFALLVGLVMVSILIRKKVLIFLVVAATVLGLVLSPNLAGRFGLTVHYGIKFLQQKLTTSLPNASAQISKPPVLPQDYSPPPATKPAQPVTAKTEKPAPGEPADLPSRIVYRSGGIRFNVEWPRAVRAFAKNPILGTGYSSITLATDNDYLRALGETGALGLASFSLIFVVIFRKILSFFQKAGEGVEKAIVAGITGLTVSLLVIAFFIDIFEASKIAILFWLLMGILVSIIKIAKPTANV